MNKYQFYITFDTHPHTAASKAISDCSLLLSQAGYQDYTVHNIDPNNKKYFLNIIKSIVQLFIHVKAGSVIFVQYPLLSGNRVFKYFIKLLRLKRVKFICVIHDLEEIRLTNTALASKYNEIDALNYYDCVIVHNQVMQNWLVNKGLNKPTVVLQVFDYLLDTQSKPEAKPVQHYKTIVFAGNLKKSSFIYSLNQLADWQINIYGPEFLPEKVTAHSNLSWKGSFSPDEIPHVLDGAFGLIWDGEHINHLDEVYGNYLKFNNPHKLSLYLAAGLPVIAPRGAAIASFITEHQLGILVDDLTELNQITVSEHQYQVYQANVLRIAEQLQKGHFFMTAVSKAESIV